MRLSESWTKRLAVGVIAILLAGVAWYLVLWAISPRAPDAHHTVRIWVRYGRPFYVGRLDATILWGFVAFWSVIFGWGGLLLLRDRFRRIRARR